MDSDEEENSELKIIDAVESIGNDYSVQNYEALLQGNSVNLRYVLFNEPTYYTIAKKVIEKEYLTFKILSSKSCIPELKSQLITKKYRDCLLYGFCTEELWINIYSELKLRNDKKNEFLFDQNEIKNILFKLVDTLAEAEKNKIYHGPLSLNNIVRNNKFEIKIIGWGQEFHIEFNQKNIKELESILPGYCYFMCPSSGGNNRYFENYFDSLIYKKDVYSITKILYRLITNNTIFNAYNQDSSKDNLDKIKSELKMKNYDDNFLKIFYDKL